MSKAEKIKARAPRGFADRGPVELAATERMLARIRETYELYGFEGVETPFVEYTDALGKFLPDQDRPNEGVFSFQDDDEQWLSLRYDLTAPLARYVAENFDALPKPYRSYRGGWVFRNEKPGPGRFRQFMQFDADTVGSASVAADAEICMMAADTLEKLGLARPIRGQDQQPQGSGRRARSHRHRRGGQGGQRLTVLRAIDKLDRLGAEGVACFSDRAARTSAAISPRAPNSSREPSSACWPSRGAKGSTMRRDHRKPSQCRRRLSARAAKGRRNWPRSLPSGGLGLWRPGRHRSLRGARPRILHRPRL